MASMHYFDSSGTNLNTFLKCKSVIEMHGITKSIDLHALSCFCYVDN